MFHKGQLIVCINDDIDGFGRPEYKYRGSLHGLTRGRIYTASKVIECYLAKSGYSVILEEIDRKSLSEIDSGFDVSRFRPIQPTSIDIFTSMLAPTDKVKA